MAEATTPSISATRNSDQCHQEERVGEGEVLGEFDEEGLVAP